MSISMSRDMYGVYTVHGSRHGPMALTRHRRHKDPPTYFWGGESKKGVAERD